MYMAVVFGLILTVCSLRLCYFTIIDVLFTALQHYSILMQAQNKCELLKLFKLL